MTLYEIIARAIVADRAEPWDDLNEDERSSWLETAKAAAIATASAVQEDIVRREDSTQSEYFGIRRVMEYLRTGDPEP